jgi:hypothetical protein
MAYSDPRRHLGGMNAYKPTTRGILITTLGVLSYMN